MDKAIERVVGAMTNSGVVSAVGNRRAIRIGEEPLDLFRTYMAVYSREQAYCQTPALGPPSAAPSLPSATPPRCRAPQ